MFPGMKTRTFENSPSILEVECSGDTLPSNSVLLTMALYTPAENTKNVLASVSLMQNKCLTSDSFSSCQLDARDSRHTRLKTLVTDLKEGESRSYGCTVGYEPSGWPWTKTMSWNTKLQRNSKSSSVSSYSDAVLRVNDSWVL
ncbi:hypothetical protein BaRGS_00018456 [Batillaria attramentaria]|uniref:Uncharacterized protein n=1 Tax=Batillaria attramentaria TaxID=370345 RepID=A0ABD0KSX3_9CAEN